jgi:hypothetical protein
VANIEFFFPLKGKDENWAASSQPQLTSPSLNNVRPYDVLENRARGGQRPGLAKRYTQQIGGDAFPVVAICKVTTID